jgi:protein gp37
VSVAIAGGTKIEWCDFTFSPWWGCERVSPACAHCYAADWARFRGKVDDLWTKTGEHRFQFMSDARWREPLKWARNAPEALGRRPRVFCASMADVFEERPELDEHRDRLFDLICATPELDWLILTKRPEFAHEWLRGFYWRTLTDPFVKVPLRNVWMGVSIENSRYTWRADVLRDLPAAVKFISAEPLLGSLFEDARSPRPAETPTLDERRRVRAPLNLTGIDWVIAGGESGPRSRRTDPTWIREILEAVDEQKICHDHQVSLFVKQLGARLAKELGQRGKGDDPSGWPEDLRVREFPR